MKMLRLSLLTTLGLLCTGCLVMSLHPFFTDNDAVFEKGLLGTWVQATAKTTLTFKQFGANAYRVTYLQHEISSPASGEKEQGEPGEFEAHLGRIGSTLFIDLYPDKDSWNRLKNDLLAIHLAPTHTISKVLLEGDKLTIAGLDPDWLKDLIDKNGPVVAHEKLDGAIVLTASTEALQSFLKKYCADPKAFPEGEEFHRQN